MSQLYGPAVVFAGVAQLLYLTTAFGVGGHLLFRARRAHSQPELLLGLHLLLALGLGYALITSALASVQLGRTEGALTASLVGAGYLATIAGLVATLHFNRVVFQRESIGALGFAVLVGLAMTAGWIGYGVREGFTARMDGGWFRFMSIGIVAANLWVAAEPLRYYRAMCRRVRLGLAEALVADRFLLWGCGSLARTGMASLGLVTAHLSEMDPQGVGIVSVMVMIGASALGLFTSVAYAFTFFPPDGYVRWVERRYAGSAESA